VDFASFQSQHPYCRIPTFLSVDETVGETVIISIQSCATLQGGVNTRKAPPVTIEVHGITSWMRENAPGDVTRRATPAFNLEAGALALRESELILGARESECAKKRDQVGPQWFLSQRDRRRCDAGPVTGTAAAARAECDSSSSRPACSDT